MFATLLVLSWTLLVYIDLYAPAAFVSIIVGDHFASCDRQSISAMLYKRIAGNSTTLHITQSKIDLFDSTQQILRLPTVCKKIDVIMPDCQDRQHCTT